MNIDVGKGKINIAMKMILAPTKNIMILKIIMLIIHIYKLF